jgi:hypothetical protein
MAGRQESQGARPKPPSETLRQRVEPAQRLAGRISWSRTVTASSRRARAEPPSSAKLHLGHGGILRTKKLASGLYYLAGHEQRRQDDDRRMRSLPAGPTVPAAGGERMYKRPAYPMHSVAVDPFEYAGADYLAMVDRYSNYCFVARLRNKTAARSYRRWKGGSWTTASRATSRATAGGSSCQTTRSGALRTTSSRLPRRRITTSPTAWLSRRSSK